MFCRELHPSSAVGTEGRPSGLGEWAHGKWDPRTMLDHCGLPDPNYGVANPISVHHATAVSRAEQLAGLILKILCPAVP